jgi:hypothetical protein
MGGERACPVGGFGRRKHSIAARALPDASGARQPGMDDDRNTRRRPRPQLEAPGDTASAITGWLGHAGQPAAQAASPVPGPHEPAAPKPAGLITTLIRASRRNWLPRKNRPEDPRTGPPVTSA